MTGDSASEGAGTVAPAPPRSSGYVDVGALEIYYERHGQGSPMLLLHGAFGTIESCFAGLLPVLAEHYHVIAGSSRVTAALAMSTGR